MPAAFERVGNYLASWQCGGCGAGARQAVQRDVSGLVYVLTVVVNPSAFEEGGVSCGTSAHVVLADQGVMDVLKTHVTAPFALSHAHEQLLKHSTAQQASILLVPVQALEH